MLTKSGLKLTAKILLQKDMDNPSKSPWHYIDQYKIPIALSFLGLVLILGGLFASGLQKSRPKEFPKESLVTAQKISVDVSGAVLKPGVYQLDTGDRVEEAIKAAGGFSESANQEYISKYLNMAQKLSDGMKIYIPAVGESGPAVQSGAVAGSSMQSKVNINTASQSELEALPGIGPVTASKIISDRLYQKIEELLERKIVSKSVFEKIKANLVVY